MEYSSGTKCTKGRIPGKKGKLDTKIEKFRTKKDAKEKEGRII